MTVAPSNANIELTGDPKLGAIKEWVQLRNIGTQPVELLGAKLRVPNVIKPIRTAGKNIFTFATSTILAPGESLRIASWAAAPARSFDTPNSLPMFYEQGKDIVELLASDGTAISTVNIDKLPPAPWVTSTLTPSGVGAHDFGSVKQGAGAKQVTFTIENGTGEDMVLTGAPFVSVSAGGSDFQVVIQPKSPVKGGEKATFTVAFDPSKVGVISGELSIAVAKLAQPVLVSLTGTCVAAAKAVLTVSHGGATLSAGASVDLGSVTLGAPAAKTSLVIENTGNAPLKLTGLTLADVGEFTLANTPTLPLDLAAGAKLTIDLGFAPANSGNKHTSLTISSDAGDMQLAIVAVGADAAVQAPGPQAILEWCWSPAPGQPLKDGETFDFGDLNRSQVDPNMMSNSAPRCWMLLVRNKGTAPLKGWLRIEDGFPQFKTFAMGMYAEEIEVPPGVVGSPFQHAIIFRVPVDAPRTGYSARVSITCDDPKVGRLTVHLKGRYVG